MRTGARLGVVAALAAAAVAVNAPLVGAAVSITVPAAASLGTAPTGTASLTVQLGTVQVTASGIVFPSYVATVSCTTFTTAGGGANKTIPCSAFSYWSGPATATTGAQNNTPGQPLEANKVTLASSRTAFSGSGLVLSISTSWRPTLVLAVPAAAVAGAYTGTITHSVA